MKLGRALTYYGFGLIILATLVLIGRSFIKGQPWFDWLAKNQELFYWLGLGIWAFGYMMLKKDSSEES